MISYLSSPSNDHSANHDGNHHNHHNHDGNHHNHHNHDGNHDEYIFDLNVLDSILEANFQINTNHDHSRSQMSHDSYSLNSTQRNTNVNDSANYYGNDADDSSDLISQESHPSNRNFGNAANSNAAA